MPETDLRGYRILVVEDEYLIADDLRKVLTAAGAEVLGPVGSVEGATDFIAGEPLIDAAILDVNLRGEMVFPAADALRARNVPFAFATGYDQWALPDRFVDTPRIEKPFNDQKVIGVLRPLIPKPRECRV